MNAIHGRATDNAMPGPFEVVDDRVDRLRDLFGSSPAILSGDDGPLRLAHHVQQEANRRADDLDVGEDLAIGLPLLAALERSVRFSWISPS